MIEHSGYSQLPVAHERGRPSTVPLTLDKVIDRMLKYTEQVDASEKNEMSELTQAARVLQEGIREDRIYYTYLMEFKESEIFETVARATFQDLFAHESFAKTWTLADFYYFFKFIQENRLRSKLKIEALDKVPLSDVVRLIGEIEAALQANDHKKLHRLAIQSVKKIPLEGGLRLRMLELLGEEDSSAEERKAA